MQKIKLIEISKSFKSKKALNNVNIEFKNNRINGLLGPNGSGKTTIFEAIQIVWLTGLSGFVPWILLHFFSLQVPRT